MLLNLTHDAWSLTLSAEEHGVTFQSGRLGPFAVLPSPLFRMKLEAADGEVREIDSASGWAHVRWISDTALLKIWFSGPDEGGDMAVILTGSPDKNGISWTVETANDSDRWSVTEITLPTPTLAGFPCTSLSPTAAAGRL